MFLLELYNLSWLALLSIYDWYCPPAPLANCNSADFVPDDIVPCNLVSDGSSLRLWVHTGKPCNPPCLWVCTGMPNDFPLLWVCTGTFPDSFDTTTVHTMSMIAVFASGDIVPPSIISNESISGNLDPPDVSADDMVSIGFVPLVVVTACDVVLNDILPDVVPEGFPLCLWVCTGTHLSPVGTMPQCPR